MNSFKFYYLESANYLKIKPNQKILAKVEESTSTTKLNLSTFELTDDDCKVIGSALRKDIFLQELDLSNCMLNDDGLSSILLGLEANKFLLSLNLKGNNIRSTGTVAIGKFLRHNNHLQNLYLEWNGTGIFPETFSYLCEGLIVNTSLKLLDLRNNQLNHFCAQSLSDVINRNSTLQNLDLRWNSIGLIGGRAILQSLSKSKNILILDITGNDIPLEVQKSIELIISLSTERYLENSENMERKLFFSSKFQCMEEEREKKIRALMEQLERKDKNFEASRKTNEKRLSDLQERIIEKDHIIEDLVKKAEELEKALNHITEEKGVVVLSLNEMETNNKMLRKDYQILLDRDRKEKEEKERMLLKEMGTIKEENVQFKKKVQEFKSMQENLDDEVVELKNTITKMEKMSQLEEQSFQEQISALTERHQKSLRDLENERKNEKTGLKEEFSEVEKCLRQKISALESTRSDLEQQMIEKDSQILASKVEAEKMMDELKKKMKEDKDKLRKQMEERIGLLESANKTQEELLKEHLETMYEIKKKSTANSILLAKEAHRTDQLKHMLESKDAEMNAAVEKVKIEVQEQLEELDQIKILLKDSQTENIVVKQKIKEMEEDHRENIKNKEKEIEHLKTEVEKQKAKVKDFFMSLNRQSNELQTSLVDFYKEFETEKKARAQSELKSNS